MIARSVRQIPLILLVLSLFASSASATTTLQIWNNTGKTVLEAGDMVQVMLSCTLDEEFKEIRFCSDNSVIYAAGVTADPFKISVLSPAPDRREYLIEFTVPHDFSSSDTSFFFVGRMYKFGQYANYTSQSRIAVRGLPKGLAPKDGSEIDKMIDFAWQPVLGATKYHLEVVHFIDGNLSKHPREIGGEIALDTHVTTNHFTFAPTKTGNYSWVVRAEADGVWGSWSSASTFAVIATADVNGKSLHDRIRLYPSPAHDVVNIESGDLRVSNVHVYDLTGKIVRIEGNIGSALTAFSVSDLSPGLYRVNVNTDHGEVLVPIVKR